MNLSGSEAALQHHHYILSQDMEGKHIPESHAALRFDWPAICGVRPEFHTALHPSFGPEDSEQPRPKSG